MKHWHKLVLIGLGTIGIVYAMVYVDVVFRAKEAYEEGEKYWRWSEHPEERIQMLNAQLAQNKAKVEDQFSKGLIGKEDHDRQLELVQFDHDQALKESSMKYAYVWYQTAVDLFSPPESKWVKLSREKMPLAKEKWKAELRAQHIPFEDYMID